MPERLRVAVHPMNERMRALARSPYGSIFAIYLALRLITFVAVPVTRFPDTQSWLTLDFSGSEVRLWAIPLFFKALPGDVLREWGQAAVSIACFTALAAITASVIQHARLKLIAFATILALGLVAPITNWDTVILGESLAISLTIGLVAAWWLFAMRPGWATVALVCVLHVLWAFLRHSDLVLSVPIAVVLAASLLIANGRALRAVVLAVVAITLAFGLPTLGKNPFNEEEVLITIVSERILTSPDRTDWFVDHGMPDGPDVRRLAGSFYTKGFGSTPIRANKRLFRWIQDDGRSTYFEFLLTHPGYLIVEPLNDATGANGAELSGAVYGKVRSVLPLPVEEMLFGGPGQLVALGFAALVLALRAFGRRGWTKRELVPGVALVMSLAMYWMLYHGVASEPARHYMQPAAAIRAMFIVVGFLAVDRLLVTRPARPRGSPGTRTSSAKPRAMPARRGGATGSRSRGAR